MCSLWGIKRNYGNYGKNLWGFIRFLFNYKGNIELIKYLKFGIKWVFNGNLWLLKKIMKIKGKFR